MSDYVFLFDLDATITKAEILPEIAVKINKEKQMRELTEKTMAGEIPFDCEKGTGRCYVVCSYKSLKMDLR